MRERENYVFQLGGSCPWDKTLDFYIFDITGVSGVCYIDPNRAYTKRI